MSAKKVIVVIQWNYKCVRKEDSKRTNEVVLKKHWNMKGVQTEGPYREDLHHKILKIG